MNLKKYKNNPKNKAEATLRAKELANHLKKELGGNWKPCVWENLGWYYSVKLGSMQVYYHIGYDYSCSICDEIGGTGGMGYWHTTRYFTHPKNAVFFAMGNANDFVKKATNIMNLNKDLTTGEKQLQKAINKYIAKRDKAKK